MTATHLPEKQFVLTSIKAHPPSSRLLVVERYLFDDDQLRLEKSLFLPEQQSLTITSSKIDRFFLDIEEGNGYYFSRGLDSSENKAWQRVALMLQNSPLLNFSELMRILFPTLAAEDFSEIKAAFSISPELSKPDTLLQLTRIAETRLATFPRGLIRQIRRLASTLSDSHKEWIEQIYRQHPDTQFVIDEKYFKKLGTHQNLTSGQELIPEKAVSLFNGDSALCKQMEGYEERREQAHYAQAVSKALASRDILLVEAATGTGKSMGYLLPLISYCNQESARAVVVTRTKSLQEQLFTSDLRKIQGLLPPRFRISILKGLANYLCLLKYKLFLSDPESLTAKNATKLLSLAIWEEETESGDLAETTLFHLTESGEFRRKLTLDESSCLGSNCAYFSDCYAYNARKNASKSNLVITNYALLMSDIQADGSILGRFSFAVLDEAHRLEAAAVSAFTVNVPLMSFSRLLERISAGRLHTLFDNQPGVNEKQDNLLEVINTHGKRLSGEVQILADKLRIILRQSRKSSSERIRFKPNGEVHDQIVDHWHSNRSNYDALIQVADEIKESVSTERDSLISEQVIQIREVLTRVTGFTEIVKTIATEHNDNKVFWGQYYDSGEIMLTAAPADVEQLLVDFLYKRYQVTILTSATLDSGDDFSWISDRLGLTSESDATATKLKIGSPFPLSEQLRVTIARYLPPPSHESYAQRLAKLIIRFRDSVRMSTMVLCTSYRLIEQLESIIKNQKNISGELLVQKAGSSPQDLLERFKHVPNPLLIGTESFWEGIDLPDDLLRLLFLTRLPFPVPDDPLEQAKSERAENRGENPFMTVSLPAAVLRLRQGMGRMIRSLSDWGAIVITDSRMARKQYGRVFIDATPSPVEIYDQESLLVKETTTWLYDKKN